MARLDCTVEGRTRNMGLMIGVCYLLGWLAPLLGRRLSLWLVRQVWRIVQVETRINSAYALGQWRSAKDHLNFEVKWLGERRSTI